MAAHFSALHDQGQKPKIAEFAAIGVEMCKMVAAQFLTEEEISLMVEKAQSAAPEISRIQSLSKLIEGLDLGPEGDPG